jgi:hypothetical protein
MRLLAASLAAAALLAAPASAQPKPKPGARTAAPETLLAGIGSGVSDEEIARQAAAAAAHPLGTLLNPVRVGGPEGERVYIARLRCADGQAPRVGARGAGGVGAYGTITNSTALDCGAAAPGRFDLVTDIYHEEHRERSAPSGFTLQPL